MTYTVTLELPEALYRSATQVAAATQRPLTDVLQESLGHSLPPLEDVSPEEAAELARLSMLDDASLWRESQRMLTQAEQTELEYLLFQQSNNALAAHEQQRMQALLDEYARLLVHKAHAWLLLARRGYRVPPQQN